MESFDYAINSCLLLQLFYKIPWFFLVVGSPVFDFSIEFVGQLSPCVSSKHLHKKKSLYLPNTTIDKYGVTYIFIFSRVHAQIGTVSFHLIPLGGKKIKVTQTYSYAKKTGDPTDERSGRLPHTALALLNAGTKMMFFDFQTGI